MTDHNNAAQAELREALNLLADHEKALGYVKSKGHDTDKAERCVQAAQERVDALLSKLRTEGVQAGDVEDDDQCDIATPPDVWEKFAGYLLDHCEGEIVSEESLQRWLHDMLHSDYEGTAATASAPVADKRAAENHFEDELERAYWEMDARIKGLGKHKGRPQPDRDAFKWAVRAMQPMPSKAAREYICICCNVPRNNCDCEPETATLASAPVADEQLRIERMARAMAKASDWDGWDTAMTVAQTPNGNEPEEEREYWRDMARAALASAPVAGNDARNPNLSRQRGWINTDGFCGFLILAGIIGAIVGGILVPEIISFLWDFAKPWIHEATK